jgi:BMFP domain-containing protein YqiC
LSSHGIINDLSRRLVEVVPDQAFGMRGELEKNFYAILQGAMTKLNLVSREEFDVQGAVLERTRLKLAELEARIQSMEQESRH